MSYNLKRALRAIGTTKARTFPDSEWNFKNLAPTFAFLLVRASRSPADYFAYRLYKSMIGAGTKDVQLIRVIVSRAETDLSRIASVFGRYHRE